MRAFAGTGRPLAALWLAALALAATSLAACSSKSTREPAKLVDIPHPEVHLSKAWSESVGDGSDGQYTKLCIALGPQAMYVAAMDGRVEARNPDTGRLIWRTRTKKRLLAGPALDGNMVVVGSLDAQVDALHADSGKPAWSVMVSSEVGGPPTGTERTVVARSIDGRVFGLDGASGARLWSFDRNEPTLALRGLSSPLVAQDRVFVGLDNGHLVALSLADGQLLWEQAISVPSGRNDLDHITDIDANLLLGDEGLFVVTYGSDLALVSPGSGQALWHRTVRSYSGMAYGDGKLFVTDSDGQVLAFDAATGSEIWKQDGLKYRQLSPPVFYDGYVMAGDYKGYLHWMSPQDGHFVGRRRFGSDPITAPPVVGPKYLYVMNVEGDIGAFQLHPAK